MDGVGLEAGVTAESRTRFSGGGLEIAKQYHQSPRTRFFNNNDITGTKNIPVIVVS